jgi:hypothetical protein
MAKKGSAPMDSILLDNVLQASAPNGQTNQSMFQVITVASPTRKVGVVGWLVSVCNTVNALCHCRIILLYSPPTTPTTHVLLIYFSGLMLRCAKVFLTASFSCCLQGGKNVFVCASPRLRNEWLYAINSAIQARKKRTSHLHDRTVTMHDFDHMLKLKETAVLGNVNPMHRGHAKRQSMHM